MRGHARSRRRSMSWRTSSRSSRPPPRSWRSECAAGQARAQPQRRVCASFLATIGGRSARGDVRCSSELYHAVDKEAWASILNRRYSTNRVTGHCNLFETFLCNVKGTASLLVSSQGFRAFSASLHAFLCSFQCSVWCSTLQYITARQPEHCQNSRTECSRLPHEGRAHGCSPFLLSSACCRAVKPAIDVSRFITARATPRARSTSFTGLLRQTRSTAAQNAGSNCAGFICCSMTAATCAYSGTIPTMFTVSGMMDSAARTNACICSSCACVPNFERSMLKLLNTQSSRRP